MHTPDLSNCDLEPIHIPGKIQGHGFLIALDLLSNIIFCSENIQEFLPVSAVDILNNSVISLEKFFQKQDNYDFFTWFNGSNKASFEPTNPYILKANGQSFNLIISTSGEFYLLEFEPVKTDLRTDFHQLAARSLSAILANTQLSGFLSKSAEEIRKIIKYDRVMIYKFHEDGHGEVVAEDKDVELIPFLGLHYPASDIPKQARELYKINHVRLIADVQDKPADLITINNQTDLDLTHAVLRAVSPIHIQYLKNMKVASSFSISLFDRGKLWGLIACHNSSPCFINYNGREAATFIGAVLSSTLGYQQQEVDQHKKHKLKIAVEKLAKQLTYNPVLQKALFDEDVTLLDVVNATGAVLVSDKKIYTCGKIPDKSFLDSLVHWLDENMPDQKYYSNRLPLEFQPALKVKEFCSGILALRITKELNDYLIWFRPEVITNVNWAGNPSKPAEFDQDIKGQLSPRKSFETWSQTVLYTSDAWDNEDINSALQVKEEIASSMIRKAVEVRKSNEKLREAYSTLDTFSYTISHDLKTPLTIINAYAQMLHEDYSSNPEALTMISGILSGTHKMELMIRRILHYSQIGQSDVQPVRINMKKMLNTIREELLLINSHHSTQIILRNTPDIIADEMMTLQVFSNLFTNALKYSSKASFPQVIIDAKESATHIEYSISDNGIGIIEADKEKIFNLFTRSDEVADYEGTGVGLSIVKRIMEKHEGEISVESDGKSGSTFNVIFQKPID